MGEGVNPPHLSVSVSKNDRVSDFMAGLWLPNLNSDMLQNNFCPQGH